MSVEASSLPVLSSADFASGQDVRWCPGCGDYSILAQMKKVLPTLGVPPAGPHCEPGERAAAGGSDQ